MSTHASHDFEFGRWVAAPPPGEEVVITGMSGRFPCSMSVEELRENLLIKQDLMTTVEKRWVLEHSEIPKLGGIIPDISKFDSGYFGLHYRQSKNMDPAVRILLEVTSEAIMDAGIHPSELEGTKTGVFLAYAWSDVNQSLVRSIAHKEEKQSFGPTGYLTSEFAHRLSYHFKLKGPSYVTDTACSSAFDSLEHAFKAIRMGTCDNAIVAGCNLTLHPRMTLQFSRIGVISAEGRSKTFDQDADGYGRAECISCILLQKSKNAKRIYAQMVHAKINDDGFKNEGVNFPSYQLQEKLLEEIYQESNIAPSDLSFFEIHGTGTNVGDVAEVTAVDNYFGKRREKPLLVGSVKSNMGHSEAASGIPSIIKVIFAMEDGCIIPNVNLRTVKEEMVGIREGRLEVVLEPTVLEGKEAIVGVSNFGFGGSNSHAVLRRVNVGKAESPKELPKLVCVSGRTEEAVKTMLDSLGGGKTHDFLALIQEIFKKEFPNHFYRGYMILSGGAPVKVSSKPIPNITTPFYIKFGNFTQNFGTMGQSLMHFPSFRASISRINTIMNIDVADIILGRKTPENCKILGAIAVQIGICDILKLLGLNPTISKESWGKLLHDYFYDATSLKDTIHGAITSEKKINFILPKPKKIGHLYNNHKNINEILTPYQVSVLAKNSILLDVSDDNLPLIENPTTFLETLGGLYEEGHNLDLRKLYNDVTFPVRNGTPMISPLIRWRHDKIWYDKVFATLKMRALTDISVSLMDDDNKYLEGHVINGQNLFPAAGYLNLVWEYFSSERMLAPKYLPVVFENCRFMRATIVPKTEIIVFSVSIQKHSGKFEVLENGEVVATGRISAPDDIKKYQTDLPTPELKQDDVTQILEEQDIYKELRLRGYHYKGLFKGLVKVNIEASTGLIRWENNWVSFIDSMLQIKILQHDSRSLYVPIGISKLVIDTEKHLKVIDNENKATLPIYSFKENDTIKSGGIEIHGLHSTSVIKRKIMAAPVLERYEFVPNHAPTTIPQSVCINIQLILEESLETMVRAVELVDEDTPDATLLMPLINDVMENIPLIQSDLTISSKTITDLPPAIKIKPIDLSSASNFLLIVATKILQKPTILNQVLKALTPNGFVLTREDADFAPTNPDLTILTQHILSNERLILFRKSTNSDGDTLIEASSTNLEWIPQLQNHLKTKSNIIIYNHTQLNGILGFVNCLQREQTEARIRCFFMMDPSPKFDPSNPFYKSQIGKNQAINVYKHGEWGTYRHLPLEPPAGGLKDHHYITMLTKGDLSSLTWVEGNLSRDTKKNLVEIHYFGLNFKDVMIASSLLDLQLGRQNEDFIIGREYSGIDSNGNRVCGMIRQGALSNLIEPDEDLCWVVPPTWSLEDAATAPVIYGTVIYGLVIANPLKPGCSILIHSAAGGVGIAALNIAFHYGCDVFVTVGTEEKKKFLMENYPRLLGSHVGNSRDCSFEDMIKRETKGRGVDVVLNSLTNEKLTASIRCLARGGELIEMGKSDMINNNALNLLLLEKEVSYHAFTLDSVFAAGIETKKQIRGLVEQGLRDYMRPLPKTIFEKDEVEKAFRYMARGNHVGKVLIRTREDEGHKIQISPRFYCDPDKSYIILGGLGGFGLELADWLVVRGAKKLVLTSRNGVQNGYQTHRIRIWQSYGTTVHISTTNTTTKQGCIDLIQDANQIGPVDAIFNSAAVMEDALFENQTIEKFKTSLAPKAIVTEHLDEVTREMCPSLRHFVVFSSLSCGRGNPGQTNYGMANSIMESICEKRKEHGYPALAIQWGPIGGVGIVAKMQKDNKEVVIGGTLQQDISNCLSLMDNFLNQKSTIVGSMVVAEKRNRNYGSGSVSDVIANILGIKDINTINPDVPLMELGMDSMMGTEVKNVLEKEFDITVTPKDFKTLTLAKLKELESGKKSDAQSKGTNSHIKTLLQYLPERGGDDSPIVKVASKMTETDDGPTVFVLPGVEGLLRSIEPLTQSLEAHIFGLQYSYTNPEDSIQETADAILPHIEAYISKEKPFYVIGYSYGAVVGIEIVSRLEQKGCIGNMVAIEGSPSYFKNAIEINFPEKSEVELEMIAVYNILALYVPEEVLINNKEKFMSCETFDQRLDLARSLVPLDVDKDKLEKQAAITLIKKFRSLLNYNFNAQKLKSNVTLYKAKMPFVLGMESDYNLSEMSENTVKVVEIEGTHVTMLESEELKNDINNLLK